MPMTTTKVVVCGNETDHIVLVCQSMILGWTYRATEFLKHLKILMSSILVMGD